MREIDPRIRVSKVSDKYCPQYISNECGVYPFVVYRLPCNGCYCCKSASLQCAYFRIDLSAIRFSHGERRLAAEFIVLIWLISRLL